MEFPNGAVLIHNPKTDQIDGVITIRELLSVCAENKAPSKVKAKDRMKSNIIEMPRSLALSEALDELGRLQPDAIVIRDEGGQFCGYFSPDDYREAVRRLETHKVMLAQLERSRSGIADAKEGGDDSDDGGGDGDLLSTLLGGFEDDDDDDDFGEATMSL